MSGILDKARAHFRAKLDGEMLSCEVPEWGLTVFWKPLNLKQQNKIYKHLADKSLIALVETLIIRARNIDGDLLFKPIDKTELMTSVDPGVINRIVEAMGEEDEESPDAEKAEGN